MNGTKFSPLIHTLKLFLKYCLFYIEGHSFYGSARGIWFLLYLIAQDLVPRYGPQDRVCSIPWATAQDLAPQMK